MAAAEQVVEEKVSSVREDLEAAFKAHAEKDQDSPDPKVASQEPAEARPRDESGRFAAKEKADASPPARETDPRSQQPGRAAAGTAQAAGEGKNAVLPASGTDAGGVREAEAQPGSGKSNAGQPEVTAAPQGWSLAAKAKWAELPADIRSEISKRESDIHRGMTRMDEERQFARNMYQAVSPYEAAFRAEGVSAPQYVANVLNVAYTLRTADPFTKAQTLATLAQQFGVDMKLLAPSQEGQSQNPEVAVLKQQYAELHQNFTRQQQESQKAQAEARAQAEREIQQSILTFAQETDASGKPKRPYFNAVQATMGALIQNGEARGLEEAYEMAVYARPDIRAQLQAEENAKREAERLAAQKAEEAKRKGKSVRGGPGGSMPTAPNPNASVREDLEAAFAEARGRI